MELGKKLGTQDIKLSFYYSQVWRRLSKKAEDTGALQGSGVKFKNPEYQDMDKKRKKTNIKSLPAVQEPPPSPPPPQSGSPGAAPVLEVQEPPPSPGGSVPVVPPGGGGRGVSPARLVALQHTGCRYLTLTSDSSAFISTQLIYNQFNKIKIITIYIWTKGMYFMR